MSGQWEVVGKKKEKSSKIPINKSNKENNKKPVLNVNIEEVLPKSQLKNLYANNKNNDDTKKSQEKPKGPDNNKPKPQKKEKQQEAPKPKPPKSIESALNSININDLKGIYEKTKSNFPDAPIVWLKELVQHLNQKMSLEIADPVFSNKTQGYPLILASQDLKKILDKAMQDAGQTNIQLFFDISVTTMATDMLKNAPTLGHKLFLQYMARKEPTLTVTNLKKHIELKNSYQNRPNIGLSILWAIGQGGYVDFNCGIKAFEELMLPLIQYKNYSKYIVKYLLDLANTAKVPITIDHYLLMLDSIYGVQKNFPNDLKKDLKKSMEKLKNLLFLDVKKGKLLNIVDLLLKKLGDNNDISKSYQECLCDIIMECFQKDISSFDIWNQIFNKSIKGSAIMLQYLNDKWDSKFPKFNNKSFNELLNNLQTNTEQGLLKKKNDPDLKKNLLLIQKLREKMTVEKKSKSSFKLMILLVILMVSGVVYYDIQQNGDWTKSKTNKLMKEYHICEYAHKGMDSIGKGFAWLDGQIDKNVPGYKETIVYYTEPYVDLFIDLSYILSNAFNDIKLNIVKKYPQVVQTVNAYAPGLIENSQNVVSNAWSTSVLYFNRSVSYLKDEVFVGQLSPENVHKVVLEAINSTQTKATEYYHWLYEKVQTTIK